MTAITGTLNPSHDRFMRRLLAVLGEADVAHEINKQLGEVQHTAMLTGGIVIWKCVMVVMEAFPCNENVYY